VCVCVWEREREKEINIRDYVYTYRSRRLRNRRDSNNGNMAKTRAFTLYTPSLHTHISPLPPAYFAIVWKVYNPPSTVIGRRWEEGRRLRLFGIRVFAIQSPPLGNYHNPRLIAECHCGEFMPRMLYIYLYVYTGIY
jgi:hypothetical protein